MRSPAPIRDLLYVCLIRGASVLVPGRQRAEGDDCVSIRSRAGSGLDGCWPCACTVGDPES